MIELIVAIIGLITLLARVFGPQVAQFTEAEVEKFRAKHPDQPNVAMLMERARAIFLQLVQEAETANWGAMTKEEIRKAKEKFVLAEALGDPSVQGAIGRVAAVGLNLDINDATILMKQAVDVLNYLHAGKKAPDVPLESLALEGARLAGPEINGEGV